MTKEDYERLGNKVRVNIMAVEDHMLNIQVLNDNEWCTGQYLVPFFATTVKRTNVFNSALAQANFEMLAMWAKDTFDLDHKKITIVLGTNLIKLAGKRS